MAASLLKRLAAVLAAVWVASGAGVAVASDQTLILISIDGFRADYLGRGVSPTLSGLAQEGVHAEAMRPSFPSITFPNHYTLVTGLRPDEHGIVNNAMEDPQIPGVVFTLGNHAAVVDERWWDDATPIWVSAERQGVKTGTMFWPGSEAAIHGVRPSQWRPYDRAMSYDARVDAALSWLDLPAADRPRFVTLYFEAVDSQGHAHGPDSPEVNAAVEQVDAAIARLVAGLKARGVYDQTNLVIVADHGMAATPLDHWLYLDDTAPAGSFRLVAIGPLAGVEPMLDQPGVAERALLGAHAHYACWRKAEVPARLHYGKHRRVPSIVCLAEDGYALVAHSYKSHLPAGEHGYDPADPRMGALFIARGPAFARGVTLKPFDNVDVYPLLTQVLGVKPEPNDGRLDEVETALAK